MAANNEKRSDGAWRRFPWVPAQHLLSGLIVILPLLTQARPTPVWVFVVGSALFCAGGALGLWSVAAMGKNRAASPEPVPGGELVATGPYQWVRHPMYLGMGLSLAGWVCLTGSHLGMWMLIPMAAVLMGKARVEETLLLGRHPGYGDYASRTGRFLPGLGKRRARD